MNPANALFIIIGILLCLVVGIRYDLNKEYNKWFEELKRQAPSYGFTEQDVEDFAHFEFREYFDQDMTIDEAIKNYLADN